MYDWRALPLKTAAALAAGLPDDSRCIRRETDSAVSPDTLLLAAIADRLTLLLWAMGGDNGDTPPLMTDRLLGRTKPAEKTFRVFDSPAEFMAAYNRWTGGESA